ncbi:DUF3386 domain-containing protein [Euhalothece natronophila Z-M001]|uniref:DUF3386 domain-containing protein n=1 Tax=Euhalothece natronophila Z-M001 TaxID=522448 RepID=A0A5B8NIR3_9CHRO|nr:DUF3386 domain-containing protein [Euhalothece natronophila]QDZ38867.1 DUF3386 domain-containing protein [Euhalothece natronophila Z-M001]
MTTTSTSKAQEIFRAAYENRYTWNENFPGYQAQLELRQGEEVYQAQVKVNGDLTVEVSDIDDEQVKESLYNQMRDIVTHRKRKSFDQAHGKNRFSLGEEDATGAVEIKVEGDSMGSNYKVRGKEISQVSRVMGPIAFTINTAESLDTGEGYIATKYNAIFRDPKTDELKEKREFEEEYANIGGYYIPIRQRVEAIAKDGNTTTTEFNFSNIELL